MKSAIVHDWLVSLGGGENVLEEILQVFPSPIYTLISDKQRLSPSKILDYEIHNSFLQKFPKSKTLHHLYLPLFPYAIEKFDFSDFDLILSSSHCVAKGILTNAEQLHICYCHTPMRYSWDLYHQYLEASNLHKGPKGLIAKIILHYMRLWDLDSSFRVDHFIANSRNTAKRIYKTYRRKAEVIYPPVDTSYFSFCPSKENYYITSSRLVPYKKIDLIVKAFSLLPERKLLVIGDGPEMKKIKPLASKNIELLGYLEKAKMKELIQKARAFIFAAIEDFGIAPVEAQACGTPVIALNKGGTRETVVENSTGIFFESQDIKSLIQAIEIFEKKENLFDLQKIRTHAETFSKERFHREYSHFVNSKYNDFSIWRTQ